MSLLETINSPADLKKIAKEDLHKLAQELRDFLVSNVAKTGGHLAPNLGVVELTLALHYIFSTPEDKIVWDVGHQAYVHKIITGRRQDFHTLRQYQGVCGFPNRKESVHDAFGTGHSSTSISAALGMAVARDLQAEDYNVVAVIGDGALTGGMALEALNSAGDMARRLIVVLNDNEMSIAKNVGAMSEYLFRMRTAPTYSRIKRDVELILKGIPTIGDRLARTAERVKDSLKYLLVPGMLFEDLGFTYIGPVDGHNLENLLLVLEEAKKINGPVLVHAITCKGKGYKPAELNPDKFHGISPFCVQTGEKLLSANPAPTYTEVFSNTLLEIAQQDSKVVAITAAMPDGTGLRAFSKAFPTRFFDVGIAEQHAVTLAAGMAAQGLKPVVALYSTFAQRAYDQILHDICLQNLPVVIALDRAGLVGDDGATHHGVFDMSFLGHIPNMTIMAPKDEAELRAMLFTAFSLARPVAIRYPRGNGEGAQLELVPKQIPLGKAEILKTGEQLMLVAVGNVSYLALEAAKQLTDNGFSCGVVNVRYVKPFDQELFLQLIAQGKKLVVLEEGILAGGFGSNLLACLNKSQQITKHNFLQIGIDDKFVPHGSKELLYMSLALDVASLVARVRKFIEDGA